jgi:hypothetical protein
VRTSGACADDAVVQPRAVASKRHDAGKHKPRRSENLAPLDDQREQIRRAAWLLPITSETSAATPVTEDWWVDQNAEALKDYSLAVSSATISAAGCTRLT